MTAPKAVVALAEGFEEIEAVTPIDVLRRAGFDLTTVGLTGRTVTGSHGIPFTADAAWDEAASLTPDVLVLPGGMPGSKNLGEHAGLREMACRVKDANGYLAAICAAPAFTLAAWGLLSGRRATCYPGCETQFPADVIYRDEAAVVVDGRFITGRGPGVAMDFSFVLLEQMAGSETATNLKKQMQY